MLKRILVRRVPIALAMVAAPMFAQTASAQSGVVDSQYEGYYDQNIGNDWYYDTYYDASEYAGAYDYGSTWWGYDYYGGYYDDNTYGDDWYFDAYELW